MAADRPPPPLDRAAGLSAVARRLLDEAGNALSRGDPDAAERSLTGVLAITPNVAEAYRLLGVTNQMRGNHATAVTHLRRAQALGSDDAITTMGLGISLHESGVADEAIASFRQACALAPDMASTWYNLGKALKVQRNREEACEALQQALSVDAAHTLARMSLADALVGLGRIVDAVAEYREVLRRHPEHADAWHALANLKTVLLSENDTAHLRRVFRKPNLALNSRIPLGFALAKALEDQKQYAEAFDVLREANALKRRQVHWDATAESARVDAIMAAFDRPLPMPADATLGKEVIFIASLPRSGSTLIEQILASHPMVEGADEILDLPQVLDAESKRRKQPFPDWVAGATSDDWARLGREYLARTARWRQERPLLTDKNMLNWEHMGAALMMLPGARIVNCRRDPVETCFACYRQLFSIGSHFSYDLDDMASYYIDFARMSSFWQRRFPQQILDYSYEALLADTEPQIRRLLDFCNVEFDPACLSFHKTIRNVLSTASAAQVRQPLQKNTAHAPHYDAQLASLRARLAAASIH